MVYRIPVIFAIFAGFLGAQAGFQTSGSFIIVSTASRKMLRVDKVDHRGVIQSSSRALWTIEHAGPDRYFIRADDGRALDASPGNGDRVECARFNGGIYQRWSIMPVGETFTIIAHDGRALETPGSLDGARLHLANRSADNSQRFLLRRTEMAP